MHKLSKIIVQEYHHKMRFSAGVRCRSLTSGQWWITKFKSEKQLKLWMFLICFTLGNDSSKGKKCCVSRAYVVCAGWPQIFGKTPLLLKKSEKTTRQLQWKVKTFNLYWFSLIAWFKGRPLDGFFIFQENLVSTFSKFNDNAVFRQDLHTVIYSIYTPSIKYWLSGRIPDIFSNPAA